MLSGNIVLLYLDKQEDESKDHGGLVAVVVGGGVSVGPAGVGGEHHHRALQTCFDESWTILTTMLLTEKAPNRPFFFLNS